MQNTNNTNNPDETNLTRKEWEAITAAEEAAQITTDSKAMLDAFNSGDGKAWFQFGNSHTTGGPAIILEE